MNRYFLPEIEYQDVEIKASLDKKSVRELEMVSIYSFYGESFKNYLWGLKVGGSVATNPFFHKNLVIFGSQDKNVYAVDIETGEKTWRFGAKEPVAYLGCLHDGRLYFCSYDGNVYCLDADSGEPIWQLGIGSPMAFGPSMFNNVLYIGARNGNAYAISLQGKVIWKFATNGPVSCPPVVHNGRVYFGSWDHNVYCLDERHGKLIWRFGTNYHINSTVSIYQNMVVFAGFDGNVYSVDNERGTLIWKLGFEKPMGNAFNPISNGVFFTCSRDFNFYAIDVMKGAVRWRFKTDGVTDASPCIHEGVIYMGSADNNVYALREEDGKLLWKFATNGHVNSALKVHKDILYVGSWDCNMYAINLDGTLKWKFPSSLGYPATVEETEESSLEPRLEVIVQSDIEGEGKYKPGRSLGDYSSGGMGQYAIGMNHYATSGLQDYAGKKKDKYL